MENAPAKAPKRITISAKEFQTFALACELGSNKGTAAVRKMYPNIKDPSQKWVKLKKKVMAVLEEEDLLAYYGLDRHEVFMRLGQLLHANKVIVDPAGLRHEIPDNTARFQTAKHMDMRGRPASPGVNVNISQTNVNVGNDGKAAQLELMRLRRDHPEMFEDMKKRLNLRDEYDSQHTGATGEDA